VNDFVEQCRREWKRLGVRAAVADDMVAELAADFAEADSPEEVLGSDAADARSFAAAWARERGVIPRRTRNPRVIVPVVAAVLALVTACGVALMLTASAGKSSQSIAPEPPDKFVATPPELGNSEPVRIYVGPPLHVTWVTTPAVRVRERPLPVRHALGGPRCYDGVDLVPTPCVWPNGDMASTAGSEVESSGIDWPKIGLGLSLFAGIGLILLASVWVWTRARRSSHAAVP
jgi:hypothetical protein